MTKKLKSGTPFVYDENDRVVGIRDPHTGTDTDLVTATRGPGGVVRNSLGELLWRQGKNLLVKQMPTRLAAPYNRWGAPTYSAKFEQAGGTIEPDLDMTCPISALPMAKITIPAGTSGVGGSQQIRYWDIPNPPEMDEDTVWMLPIRMPHGAGNFQVQMLVSHGSTIGVPNNWRQINFTSTEIPGGLYIITFLNREIRVNASTFGVVGTTERNIEWTEQDGTSWDLPARSITVRVSRTTNQPDALVCGMGSLSYARKGWAMGAVMWSADDIPVSIRDYMLPVLEEYGLSFTGNVTSSYAGDLETRMSHADVMRMIGNRGEVWGHARMHENLRDVSEAECIQALKQSRDYWLARGIPEAAYLMAYPFGAYNDAVIARMRALGYRMARATRGDTWNPIAPGINPYALPSYNPEGKQKWQPLSMINRAKKTGLGLSIYTHNCVPGGTGLNEPPSSTEFYQDHLRDWCESHAKGIQEGTLIDCLHTEWFKACGIDPLRDQLVD